MLTLFDPHTEGYRLHRVEVYNWGTFDGLHIIEPKGANALLTGANGSGKSTLVDALITLLVPPLQRGYNQASGGTQKRGERDVKSYVQGEYGRVLDDDDRDKRLRLRSREHYTVLLGVFVNASSRRTVSLAQLIWLEGEKPDIVYILAEKPLSISANLAFSGNKTQFKSQIKGIGAEVFDEFSRYSSRFRNLFNLRSEKALELFNKIVSLKEISGLNDFVRNYMLEKLNAKALVEGLYSGYEHLTSVHGMILKARKQRDHLQPLREEWSRYSALKSQIEEARACGEVFPYYIAYRQTELLGSAIQRTEQTIKEIEGRAAEASAEREAQQEEYTQIKTAILNDDVGRRLEELAQQIKVQEQERYKRQKQNADYARMVIKFGLLGYSTEEAFRTNIQQIPRLQHEIDIAYQALIRQRDELVGQRSGLDRNIADLEGQLTSLRGRKSQIPSETFEIRVQIVNALGIRPEDLPFVGEMLKVKESEARWKPAIERLLRSYGQQLLVPDRYYSTLRQYVDQTSLRGRLIYHRVTDVQPTAQPEHSEALFYKVEINSEAPSQLAAWLKLDLIRNYDYICCETPQAFDSTPRAITIRGQIKHSRTRHEKDDRKGFGDPSGYVLGWDNRAKVEALQKHLQAAKDRARQLQQDIEAIETEQESQNEKRQNLRKLAEIERFESIDYKAVQALIDDLQ